MSFQVQLVDVPDNEKVKIIYLSGEIDRACLDEFKSQCEPLLQLDNVKTYVFEFRDVDFIDSSMIGWLAGVYSELAEKGQKCLLTEANEKLLDIITLVGLTSIIPHFATLQEVLGNEAAEM